MHTLHSVLYMAPGISEVALKQMPNNEFTGDSKQYATKGIEGTTIYSRDDFFFMPGGFSKFIAQAGRGLGSGDLLGANLTNCRHVSQDLVSEDTARQGRWL